MYIITVIPIKKGFQKDSLSYFSLAPVPIGSIVTVPIRKKVTPAIVIDREDARERKSDLKTADFELRKVLDTVGFSPFTKEFFATCERMARYTVGSTGSVIKNMLPGVYLDNISTLKRPIEKEEGKQKENLKHEKLIFQSREEDRVGFYRTLIREAFAKRESIMIIVPTRYDIDTYRAQLSRGIEDYVFSFHTEMPKKNLIDDYNKVVTKDHPILIICTGVFLSIPRHDIGTIIIEHESSDSYKQQARPYIDIRTFAEAFSATKKIRLIYSDTLLRPETLYRHERGELGEVHSPSFRLSEVERKIVVDMKADKEAKSMKTKDKTFSVLSETTKSMLRYALERGESVLLYSLRKGLAPVTVCNDCGHTLLCPDCETPVVIYSAKRKVNDTKDPPRIFMCNKCGRKDTTEVRCPVCASWNLKPLGVGTDRVHNEVQELFPKAKIWQIDRESTPTDKDARAQVLEFAKEGGILISTEMIFSHLRTPVNHSAIISLDGLLSIPSFNITQKVLHIIEKMHSMTKHNLIIQTRIPENQVLSQILSGNVLPLYREDLKERELYGYPPFKRLIKISFTGDKEDTEQARLYINEELAQYDPQIFSAFVSKIRNQYVTNTIIKADPKLWQRPDSDKNIQDESLREKLAILPPSFSINVDPEDLL
jgi:primosomal protein N' (replication factor Y)